MVLGVENILRKRPFSKILAIAWKKVWPNSKVTTKDNFRVLKWGKKRLFCERMWDQFLFAEWGGERYDRLKNIISGLKTVEVKISLKKS